MKTLSRSLFFTIPILLFSCSAKNPAPEIIPTAPQTEAVSPLLETPPEISINPDIQAVEQEPQSIEELEQEQQSPEALLEKAMNAYQEALTAWDEGNLEAAIASLDQAFDLILDIQIAQDSPLIQEKNDIRLLIAKRIQEIYASLETAIGGNHNSIPLEENKWVLQEIKSFQTVERKSFLDAYQRSGLYREMILEELRKEGLPEELSWLPVIESGFKIRAYSRARALGLWQFIASTGYRYGLKRSNWIDERMNPEKATQAAVKYLKELHSWFGDWSTALAGYNCGEFRVQRVIRNQRQNYMDHFWDLYPMLPRETARFVPRFIATLLIVNNPDKYGMELPDPLPPLSYETITINKPIRLATMSTQLGLSSDTIADMNPELRHQSTPEQEYQLKVPAGTANQAMRLAESLSRWVPPEASFEYYQVRRGDTVSGIAQRFRTSVSNIARLNNLARGYRIYPGQRLKIPGRAAVSYSSTQARPLIKEGDNLIYQVKRGDSLYLIANHFQTTVQKIKSQNELSDNMLRVGQKLVIQSGASEGGGYYTVQSGDTPYKIAQRFGMGLNALLTLNGLTTRSTIYPGQQLRVAAGENK